MLSIINIRILTINPVYAITPLTGINYDFTMSGAYISMLNFLSKPKKHSTALIRVNNIVAIGVIYAIKNMV